MDHSTTVRKLQQEILQSFLAGDLTAEEINVNEEQENGHSYPRYDSDVKVIVAWCLVIAGPQHFGFELVDGQLVGPISTALNTIFPEHPRNLSQASVALHLHAVTRFGSKDRCLTLPRELVEAVREHIGNPEGGIAKYFKERKLEVPAELDPRVAEAAIVKDETEEAREAKNKLKAAQRAKRREHLKTTAAEAFLSGQLSFSELTSVTEEDYTILNRAYSVPEKVIVAWCLIIARPEVFGFRREHDKLIGTVGPVFKRILDPERDTVNASLSMGLHKRYGGYVEVTLPRTLIELVREHIGNPEGGIARYFKERKLEVPAELDPRVAEAAVAKQEPASEPPVDTAEGAHPAEATPSEMSTASNAPDPDITMAAEQLLERLRKVHTPDVLAALKRLL
jgi:hypothetical protein